jgi:hypothetical protein
VKVLLESRLHLKNLDSAMTATVCQEAVVLDVGKITVEPMPLTYVLNV